MIIKKLRLNNIRSYSDTIVSVPEGSVLLSGNIGSGKSSILLAIDFALFGLRQGELSGNGLLRNGENSGSVELEFEIGDNNIEIKRALKRGNKSISQDTGFLSINGNKELLSAIELKERILSILGYPKSLLTKSKNLIFRYTVYTPQEEMKEILVGDTDLRLDTLRKVFGIDKYKRVKENSRILLSYLREQKREIEGRINNLDEIIEERNEKEKNKIEINSKISIITPRIEEIKTQIINKKEEIIKVEEKIKVLNSLKKDFSVNQNSIESKKTRLNETEEELKRTLRFITEHKEVDIPDQESLKNKINQKEKELKLLENESLSLSLFLKEADIKKKSSQDLIDKLNQLDICPICKQEVKENHKHSIKEKEETVISDSINKIIELNKKKNNLKEKLLRLKEEIEALKKEDNSIQLKIFQKNRLNEKIESKTKLEREKSILEKELTELGKKNKELTLKAEELSRIDYYSIRKEFDIFLTKEKELEMEKFGYEKDKKNINQSIEKLEVEIKSKLKDKETLTKFSNIIFFIDEHFSSLMEVMERKVMLKVHSDFNDFFQKWFSMLVEDEILIVKLDETFTPVIEQQGHDIDYKYLSGGERTAAALSYRLALNQTINNIVTEIRTKDLIILDEPTDGFSSEQLDKMKYVIDELEAKQIILVSHDQKIESFVNKVIRIEKKGGASKII
ncbi:hypothetical protein J4413_01425 [Candidatus Woesearchaeota archaeon]|nr:hypothetical protein [Candidatus Woesearchaeota archaeon]